MEEIFKEIFGKYNLTDEQLHKFIADFSTGLIISLIVNVNNLTKQDEVKLEEYVKEQDLKKVMQLLEEKFNSREEWAKYVQAQAVPLFENYINTVIAK